jgi:hypothetical protein
MSTTTVNPSRDKFPDCLGEPLASELKAWMDRTIREQALEETKYGRCARILLRARRDGRTDEEVISKARPLINAMGRALEEGTSEDKKPTRRTKRARTPKEAA